MTRPRILTFSTLYPNAAQPNHGVFVENRLRHLVATGAVQSVVVAPTPYLPASLSRFERWSGYARAPRRESRNGLTVHHPRYLVIPRVGMTVAPAFLAAAGLAALQRIRREGYDFDLIDAHYLYPDGVAAAWIGRRLGKPVVVTARGTDVNLIPRYRLPRRMIVGALRQVAGIIAVSEALRDAIGDLGIAREAVTVLRNGVDLDLFAPCDRAAARQHLGLSRTTLLSVGHLIDRKGHDLVIRALLQLPEFDLLIVGDGPMRRPLDELAASLGLAGRVRFLGARPHRDMPAIYGAADALVLASSREGWANVLLEAMACGTPVVASNIWGNPEVVHPPAAGRLMAERSAQGVADAVRQLFAAPPDRRATRRYAERFSWNDTSAGQTALFERVLARASGAHPVAAVPGARLGFGRDTAAR